MNYFKDTDSFFNLPINLREQFAGLNQSFGYDMLYVRNCKYVKCSCFNESYGSPNPECPLCFGSGYFASIEKVHCIEKSPFRGKDNNKLTQSDIGSFDAGEIHIYAEFQTLPKNKDFLIKVTWDKHGRPVDVLRVCEIQNAHEYRMDGGRCELCKLIAKERPDKLDLFKTQLKQLSPSLKQQLARGGKAIWQYKPLTK